MFSYHEEGRRGKYEEGNRRNEEGSTGGKETSEQRLPSMKNVHLARALQGLRGEKGAVLLKEGEKAGITHGPPCSSE